MDTISSSLVLEGLPAFDALEIADYRDNMSAIYDKHRLDASKIRLLILHPGRRSDTIVCDLKVVALPSITDRTLRSTYEALSYVCGPPNPVFEITLESRSVSVRENLFQALQQLRSPTHIRELWVDALSINQLDLVERSQQVMRMGDIYRSAAKVLAFLGLAEDPDLRAFFVQIQMSQSSGLSPLQQRSKLLQTMDKCKYWSRAWVCQEFLAAQTLEIIYGDVSLPWALLQRALYNPQAPTGEKHHIRRSTAALRSANPSWALCEQRMRGRRRFPLLSLLSANYQRQCSEPSDKVYSILSLAQGQDNPASRIPVNYLRPVGDLFYDVWCAALACTPLIPSHELFAHASFLKRLLDLRSNFRIEEDCYRTALVPQRLCDTAVEAMGFVTGEVVHSQELDLSAPPQLPLDARLSVPPKDCSRRELNWATALDGFCKVPGSLQEFGDEQLILRLIHNVYRTDARLALYIPSHTLRKVFRRTWHPNESYLPIKSPANIVSLELNRVHGKENVLGIAYGQPIVADRVVQFLGCDTTLCVSRSSDNPGRWSGRSLTGKVLYGERSDPWKSSVTDIEYQFDGLRDSTILSQLQFKSITIPVRPNEIIYLAS